MWYTNTIVLLIKIQNVKNISDLDEQLCLLSELMLMLVTTNNHNAGLVRRGSKAGELSWWIHRTKWQHKGKWKYILRQPSKMVLKWFPRTVYVMNGLLNCGKSHVIVILVLGKEGEGISILWALVVDNWLLCSGNHP